MVSDPVFRLRIMLTLKLAEHCLTINEVEEIVRKFSLENNTDIELAKLSIADIVEKRGKYALLSKEGKLLLELIRRSIDK